MALADISALRLPGNYLATSVDEPNIGPAVEEFLERMRDEPDPRLALASIEMYAAGVLSAAPDPEEVSFLYQGLSDRWPNEPLVNYRHAAYLLLQLQQLTAKAPKNSPLDETLGTAGAARAEDLAMRARRELQRVAFSDQNNSVVQYETAWSYLVLGDDVKAMAWFEKGLEKPEFDPGDESVLGYCARLTTLAGIPSMEGLISIRQVSRFQPSYLAARMEALCSRLLSDSVIRTREFSDIEYANYLAAFEDLGEKLFHTAGVARQMQSSFVTSGILWQKMLDESSAIGDEELHAVARKQMAQVSYRYLLLGWQRGAAGLMPQQSVVELGIPIDLRLPFSKTAQTIGAALLTTMIVILLPALLAGFAALAVKSLRELALALFVLFIFSGLAYSASFYSVVRERASTTSALEKRLAVILSSPEFVRENGQPASPADFRTDITKEMLYTLNYTTQAGRVLTYVGTRDCYDALVDSLSKPDLVRSVEVMRVLEEATGVDFGFDIYGSRSEAFDAARAWQRWWRVNRESFPETAGSPSGAPGPRGA